MEAKQADVMCAGCGRARMIGDEESLCPECYAQLMGGEAVWSSNDDLTDVKATIEGE